MIVPTKTGLSGICDKCSRTHTLSPNIDEARIELSELGWLECARAGRGRARWLWFCESCRPKPHVGRTLGTDGFIRASDVEDPQARKLIEDVRDSLLKKS